MTENELKKAIKIACERDRMQQALRRIDQNKWYLQIGYECATGEWVGDSEFEEVLKEPLYLAMNTVRLELAHRIAEKTKELRALGVGAGDTDRKEEEE